MFERHYCISSKDFLPWHASNLPKAGFHSIAPIPSGLDFPHAIYFLSILTYPPNHFTYFLLFGVSSDPYSWLATSRLIVSVNAREHHSNLGWYNTWPLLTPTPFSTLLLSFWFALEFEWLYLILAFIGKQIRLSSLWDTTILVKSNPYSNSWTQPVWKRKYKKNLFFFSPFSPMPPRPGQVKISSPSISSTKSSKPLPLTTKYRIPITSS